jgi:hypothetical protein
VHAGSEVHGQEKIHFGKRNRCPDDPACSLKQLSAKGSVRKAGDEFVVEAKMEGASAKELNRTFLCALRKMEKRKKLRAEWTSVTASAKVFSTMS